MSISYKKGLWTVDPFKKKKGHALLSASALAPINIWYIGQNLQTSMLDQKSPKVVWHKEEVGFLYVVDVVEITPVTVAMDSRVVSSAGKRDISWKSVLRISKVVEIWATEPSLNHLLPQKGMHLEELLPVLEKGNTSPMQSLVAKSKRTLQMLSLVWLKSLLLMFMIY